MHDGQIGGFFAFQNVAGVNAELPIIVCDAKAMSALPPKVDIRWFDCVGVTSDSVPQ